MTTLNPGDIAIIGATYDSTPYKLSIVALRAIDAGTTIRITDYGYDETTSQFGATSTVSTAEGGIEWTLTAPARVKVVVA